MKQEGMFKRIENAYHKCTIERMATRVQKKDLTPSSFKEAAKRMRTVLDLEHGRWFNPSLEDDDLKYIAKIADVSLLDVRMAREIMLEGTSSQREAARKNDEGLHKTYKEVEQQNASKNTFQKIESEFNGRCKKYEDSGMEYDDIKWVAKQVGASYVDVSMAKEILLEGTPSQKKAARNIGTSIYEIYREVELAKPYLSKATTT